MVINRKSSFGIGNEICWFIRHFSIRSSHLVFKLEKQQICNVLWLKNCGWKALEQCKMFYNFPRSSHNRGWTDNTCLALTNATRKSCAPHAGKTGGVLKTRRRWQRLYNTAKPLGDATNKGCVCWCSCHFYRSLISRNCFFLSKSYEAAVCRVLNFDGWNNKPGWRKVRTVGFPL